jgi:aminoglycoside phosphotransferase (APT) family kinase protein
MGETGDGLDRGIVAWARAALGGRITGIERLVSGNSRTTWGATLETDDGSRPVVVRVDDGDGPFSATALDLEREARTYRALQETGVAIPRLYAFDRERRVLVLERVRGEPAWSEDVLAALLGELRKLHRLDPETIGLPGARTAGGELDLWEGIAARRIDPRSPFADFALAFLRARFPGEPARLAVLHGDPGVGNLLWADGRITALLDWEMAHAGDPYDDLGFLTVRTAMHDLALSDFGDAVRAHYLGEADASLDEERLAFWQAFAILRNLIICESSIANPSPGRDRLIHRLLLPSLKRLLVDSLAHLDGVQLPGPERFGEPPELPGAETLAQIAAEVAALLPGIEDRDLRQRGRRARYLLDQFATTWPLAGRLAAAAAAEGAPAADPAERLLQLARVADREIALFPRAAKLAAALPEGFGGRPA